MKVTVAALLGARRFLGWSQKEMVFPGGTVEDLLKEVKSTEGASLASLLIQPDGTLNPRFRFALSQQVIDKPALKLQVKEGDRLVVMESMHIPSLTC
jgi:hypothetical protein